MKIVLGLVYLVVGVLSASVSVFSAEEMQHLDGDPSATHKVSFEMVLKVSETKTEVLGTLNIAMFGTVVPKTVLNFVELSRGTYGFGYEGSIFHRIIAEFMIQGGDFVAGKGTGGYSIYNDHGKFDDENFELQHSKRGRVSMANSGPNTNGAQFFMSTAQELHYLDGKYVVFGQLVSGFDVLDKIATAAKDDKDRPFSPASINKITVIDVDKVAGGEDTSPVIEDPTYFYRYLAFLLVAAVLAFLGRKHYFKRQLATDKKDASLYN